MKNQFIKNPFLIFFLLSMLLLTCSPSLVHQRKGWQSEQIGNYEKAITEFKLAIQIKDNPNCYFGLFQAYLKKGVNDSAFLFLNNGLQKYPKDKWLLITAAHLFERQSDYCEALRFYLLANKTEFGNITNSMYKVMKQYIKSMNDSISKYNLDCENKINKTEK